VPKRHWGKPGTKEKMTREQDNSRGVLLRIRDGLNSQKKISAVGSGEGGKTKKQMKAKKKML